MAACQRSRKLQILLGSKQADWHGVEKHRPLAKLSLCKIWCWLNFAKPCLVGDCLDGCNP
eukprot:scaffold73918_cov17-Prasinocladus_malaysianus.AAC.1